MSTATEYMKRRRKEDPLFKARANRYTARSNRKRATGFTHDLYERTYIFQDGRCGICRVELPFERKNTCADHGVNGPRGILCSICNMALGHYEKMLSIIDRVNNYLNNPPATQA
jgi:hypothetical protein